MENWQASDPDAEADFAAFLTGEEEPKVELVVAPSKAIERRRETFDRIEKLTDEVLAESMGVVNGALRFHEIEPGQTEPSEEWVTELGQREAKKQFELAQAANLPSNKAPVGLKIAVQVATGILKSRGEKGATPSLNVQFISIQQPTFNYPTKKVER